MAPADVPIITLPMPIYEYRRPDGSTFEVQQSFSEEALTHDPETGVAVQRVLHAPAVHFKGSGFYNTDYGTRKRQREEGDKSQSKQDAPSKESSTAKESSAAAGSESPKPSKSTTSSADGSQGTGKAEPAVKK